MDREKINHLDVGVLNIEKEVTATPAAGRSLAAVLAGAQGHDVLTNRAGKQITGEGLLQECDYDELAAAIGKATHVGSDGKPLPPGSKLVTAEELADAIAGVSTQLDGMEWDADFLELVEKYGISTVTYVDGKFSGIQLIAEGASQDVKELRQEIEQLIASGGIGGEYDADAVRGLRWEIAEADTVGILSEGKAPTKGGELQYTPIMTLPVYRGTDGEPIRGGAELVQTHDLAGYMTADELSGLGLVTTEDLDAKGYVTGEELDGKDYASKADLEGLVTEDALTAKDYASKNDIKDFVTDEELSGKNYASKDDLKGMVTEEALEAKGYASKNDLKGVVTADELEGKGYVTGEELTGRGYVTGEELSGKDYVSTPQLEAELDGRGYMTATDVEQKGYVTAPQMEAQGYITGAQVDARRYVSEADLDSKGYVTGDQLAAEAKVVSSGSIETTPVSSGGTQIEVRRTPKNDNALVVSPTGVYVPQETERVFQKDVTASPIVVTTTKGTTTAGGKKETTKIGVKVSTAADNILEVKSNALYVGKPEAGITESDLAAKGYLTAKDVTLTEVSYDDRYANLVVKTTTEGKDGQVVVKATEQEILGSVLGANAVHASGIAEMQVGRNAGTEPLAPPFAKLCIRTDRREDGWLNSPRGMLGSTTPLRVDSAIPTYDATRSNYAHRMLSGPTSKSNAHGFFDVVQVYSPEGAKTVPKLGWEQPTKIATDGRGTPEWVYLPPSGRKTPGTVVVALSETIKKSMEAQQAWMFRVSNPIPLRSRVSTSRWEATWDMPTGYALLPYVWIPREYLDAATAGGSFSFDKSLFPWLWREWSEYLSAPLSVETGNPVGAFEVPLELLLGPQYKYMEDYLGIVVHI